MIDLSTITLSTMYLNNTVQDYLIALAIVAGTFILLKIFRSYVLSIFKKLAEKTDNVLDDLIIEFVEEMHGPLFIFLGIYFGSQTLVLPEIADTILEYMVILFVIYYVIRGISKIIDYFVRKQVNKRDDDDDTIAIVVGMMAKGIVWVIGFLFVLSNLGVNVLSLVAGLGVGGIAIAFALQKILEDIFSSFTIYFDKPFQVGDYIVIGEDSGTVEKIGLKTTRIRHLDGQELVVSNRELTSSRIHNYKKMKQRRVAFKIGIEYGTPMAKQKKIPDMVTKIIKKVKRAELDRVHFKSYGDFALIYEIVYYIDSRDYGLYMDTQQEINLELGEAFQKEKIEFAFPSQTIYLKK